MPRSAPESLQLSTRHRLPLPSYTFANLPMSSTGIPSTPLSKIKILFLGDSGAGKTALLRQFLEGRFARTLATVGFDVEFKTMDIKNRQVKLEIWDTAGQEAYRAVVPSHYRRTKGAILVYDMTKPESLKNLQNWVDQLNLFADPSPSMIVVGNKSDLLQDLAEAEGKSQVFTLGREFAESVGAFKHATTSAKVGTGVKEVFEDLVREILLTAYMEAPEGFRPDEVDGNGPRNNSSGCRC